jgi:hypothetical protein
MSDKFSHTESDKSSGSCKSCPFSICVNVIHIVISEDDETDSEIKRTVRFSDVTIHELDDELLHQEKEERIALWSERSRDMPYREYPCEQYKKKSRIEHARFIFEANKKFFGEDDLITELSRSELDRLECEEQRAKDRRSVFESFVVFENEGSNIDIESDDESKDNDDDESKDNDDDESKDNDDESKDNDDDESKDNDDDKDDSKDDSKDDNITATDITVYHSIISKVCTYRAVKTYHDNIFEKNILPKREKNIDKKLKFRSFGFFQ